MNARMELSDDVQLAFRWYGRAVRSGDPVARARCVLAGNVLAVAHEQQRLQPDIAASMDAGPASIEAGVGAEMERLKGWVPRSSGSTTTPGVLSPNTTG